MDLKFIMKWYKCTNQFKVFFMIKDMLLEFIVVSQAQSRQAQQYLQQVLHFVKKKN